MRARVWALIGPLSLVLAGCASLPAIPGPGASTEPSAASSAASAPGLSFPQRVEIPSIGVSATLVATGLNPDGTAQVPPVEQPLQPSFLDWSDDQAPIRPIVIFGHVNGTTGGKHVPGIFTELPSLQPNDDVVLRFADGRVKHYLVTRTVQVPKNVFPTDLVYGPPAGLTDPAQSQLRLITCTGLFNPTAKSYADNKIVFAQAR